ncbi:hypothetical protein F7984_10050 [Pradoshia sp. D12]|uniref:hypothetical protein n=1 Tax=Bacillaceae TaxID=186817 RepID=UPI00112AF766|nr:MULTISPECIES: hypothetical protein [Bacillaceae]QFK71549.1 hypothetical protein F7984_10050 [Pradoshia sp. D12]TPF73344.1 hypothetical protein FHY44_06445 [Bacillus sp. D12]
MIKKDSENQFIESLPVEFGDKVDLFGQMIVTIGNLLTVLGISFEASEVEEIEEEEQLENTADSSLPPDQANESNLGFILALIGASTITIGDLVSIGGTFLDIKQSELNEKNEQTYREEQNKQFKKIENQITLLQNDVNALFSLVNSLKNEVSHIQNFLYARYN